VLRTALRGWDFSPDLPIDALLGVVLVGLIGGAWYARRDTEHGTEQSGERPHQREAPAVTHEQDGLALLVGPADSCGTDRPPHDSREHDDRKHVRQHEEELWGDVDLTAEDLQLDLERIGETEQ
jgi:hypothetical protein